MELKVGDLEKVYKMTLAEFRLREYAYMREQQWDWAKFRLVGYMAIRAFNINPKDIPKTLGDVMPLEFVDEGNKINITDRQKGIIKGAQEAFFKQQKMKKIG